MDHQVVVITGISGFLGFGAAHEALKYGYRVRGVIRKEAQRERVQAAVPEAWRSKVELVAVPDLSAKGALDNIVKDASYIMHVASPIGVETDNYERDYIRPAVDMTTNVLSAAASSGSVKRVVMTSSVSAYVPSHELAAGKFTKEIVRSDDDIIHYTGTEAFPHHYPAYAASKSLALDAATDFLQTHSPPFDLVVLVPPFVFGPSQLPETVENFARGSNGLLLGHLLGEDSGFPLATISVHIDDVSRAHVAALSEGVAPGRYLLDCKETDWAVPRKVVERDFPEQLGGLFFPKEAEVKTIKLLLDESKAEKAFGLKFKSFETQVKDTAQYYLGLLPE